jgi:hypothetical protein
MGLGSRGAIAPHRGHTSNAVVVTGAGCGTGSGAGRPWWLGFQLASRARSGDGDFSTLMGRAVGICGGETARNLMARGVGVVASRGRFMGGVGFSSWLCPR